MSKLPPAVASKYHHAAYVINLSQSKRRLHHAMEHYTEQGWDRLFGPLHVSEAIDGRHVQLPAFWTRNTDTYTKYYPIVDTLGMYGSYASHKKLLQQFIADDLDYIMVLEDDIVFIDNVVDTFIEFYKHVPPDWEVIMLGYTPNSPPYLVNAHVVKASARGCNMADAYLISRQGARTYLAGLKHNQAVLGFTANEPIDCQFSRMHHTMNVYMPPTRYDVHGKFPSVIG